MSRRSSLWASSTPHGTSASPRMRSIWTALFSNRRTDTPRRASTVAIAAPATPAPAITTSVVWDISLDSSTVQGIAVDLEPRSAPGLDALMKNPMVDASQLALRAVSCEPRRFEGYRIPEDQSGGSRRIFDLSLAGGATHVAYGSIATGSSRQQVWGCPLWP